MVADRPVSAGEAQCSKFERIDKCVDPPYRIIFRDVLIHLRRKQDGLGTFGLLDEALHTDLPKA